MDYEWFEEEFERLSGIRLICYKEKQMKRRILTLMERKKVDGFEAFLQLLEKNPKELSSFIDYITINVTEFFRTQEHWQYLEDVILKELLENTQEKLLIWSTACSTGEEPYSVAMSLLKKAPTSRFHIIASDIDEGVLQKARGGLFDERSMENLSPSDKERFFTKGNQGWSISEEVRSCVSFQKLDLLRNPYPTGCHLILCRNILIYFTEETKDQIYRQFKESLVPNGYLFTGNAEQIVYYKMYGYRRDKSYVYRNA